LPRTLDMMRLRVGLSTVSMRITYDLDAQGSAFLQTFERVAGRREPIKTMNPYESFTFVYVWRFATRRNLA
ncbi:MAG: hypothetical protein OXH63_16370, partial [Gemmatimonadetes bacterium]|nr:hypothetical protein [Gemmatimonadota bacterium]